MKDRRIPTILGLGVLIVGISAGVFLVQKSQVYRLRASPGAQPKNVRITNINDSFFTVSWTTEEQTLGFIRYGKGGVLDKVVEEGIEAGSFTHSLTTTLLEPDSVYSFVIVSQDKDYDNNGIPWQVKTGPTLTLPLTPTNISGSVVLPSGQPLARALVYASVGGSSLQSTISSTDGSWIIPLSIARTQDLSGYMNIDPTKSLVEISVQAGPLGVSSIQIYSASANPTPQVTIGQSFDFRSLPVAVPQETPSAGIELPEEEVSKEKEKSSKFDLSLPAPSDKVVTLDSIEEGEVVSQARPSFSGKATPGIILTVTLESEPISDEVIVGSSGVWSWVPTEDLSEGEHKITINWREDSGILRVLTASFTVRAQIGGSLQSSPSPLATQTPTPSPSPLPIATPTPLASQLPQELPSAGSLTHSFSLLILGIGSFFLGAFSFVFLLRKDS